MARDIRPHVVPNVGSSASEGYLGHGTVPNPGRGHVLSVFHRFVIDLLCSAFNPTLESNVAFLDEIDVL